MPTPESVRGPIEQTHNATRDAREKTYTTARVALETTYHNDLRTIQTNKEAALLAAGLNADGGVPPTFDGQPSAYSRPYNTTSPAITGTPATGQVLTSSTGTWTGADSYTQQWYRDGVVIAGATALTHTLIVADEGKALKCRITAINEQGSTVKDSNTVTPHA